LTNSGASSPPTVDIAPPRERLSLSGHSVKLDPATHAVRGDLADIELAHRVFAPHYARALRYRVTAETPVLASPGDADVRGKLAIGDSFDVLDISGGYAWGKLSDGTPGYVVMSALIPA
jgi:hypothetical protein